MKQVIIGIIKDATEVKQFRKLDGKTNVKCILHIVAVDEFPYPQELAVTVCGLLTWYAKAINHVVEVEYINRVFQFDKNGMKCFGNDVYATNIKEVA
jgi:hypothetical protein